MLVALLLIVPCHSLLTFNSEEAKARPVTKVLGLLQGMKDQLETEAKEEEELMDKYNCWCKENSEGKATSVDAAEAQIKEMEGKVDALKATSAGLSTEIGNLGQEVESNEVSMDESEVMRNKQIEQFLQDESELENSVEEVQTARNVIAERHGDTSLLQTSQQQAIVQTVQRLLAKQSSHLRKDHSRKVAQLLQDPSSTVYVEEALTDLQTDFETGLADLKDQESTHKSDYEKMMLAMRSQIDAGRSQMAAKKEQMTAADEERAQTQQAIKDSRETMGEDIAFAKDVKEKCAKKAKEWENRQKTRADETQSVAKAIEVLSDDASHEVFGKTFSFLQVGTRDANARAARAAEMLTTVGKKLDQRLVTLGLEAKIDGFTKVKGKIDTLIANLKKEQVDEVEKKDYCIAQFQKNKLATDKKTSIAKKLGAKAEEQKMKMQKASEAMDALKSDIEELKKQQTLVSQNREKENAEFQKVVKEQRLTQDLLKKALDSLAAFYNKAGGEPGSFLQKAKANPEEPETFRSYQKSSSSNGVMLMLQQLVADAKEMETEATAAEAESQADYEAFTKDMTADLEKKTKTIADKADFSAKSEEEFLEAKQSKKGVEKELDTLAGTKLDLHESCDWAMQNFDARQKARVEEMDALNTAKAYLSGAKL